jgi:subtilase family serine protease
MAAAAMAGAGAVAGPLSTAAASATVATVGVAPVVPAGSVDLGAAPPDGVLPLVVTLRPRDPAALASFITQLYDPSSSRYHQFLAKGAFGPRFGASAATVSAVMETLSSLGLPKGTVSPNDLMVSLTTTVGAAEAALSVSIDQYRLDTGRTAFANTTPPKVPAAIAPSIAGIVGLSTLVQAQPLGLSQTPVTSGATSGRRAQSSQAAAAGQPKACSTAAKVATSYTATELAGAYGFTTGAYDQSRFGTGETIALYELAAFKAATVETYEACYGITTTVTPIKVTGGSTTTTGNGAVEVNLDIDDVAGLAPEATIDVFEAPNRQVAILHEYTTIASADTAQVVSSSWGLCEPRSQATAIKAEETLFEQMAADGQSMMAAAGDSGSEDCHAATSNTTSLNVDDPASDPYVTGVGGTDLIALTNPPTETVWNERATRDGAGGGGISERWAMPAYQKVLGVNADSSGKPCGAKSGTYCREVPDVSASAASQGYAIYFRRWGDAFGTSAASPLWAAVTALADQACGSRAGLLNPALYTHAGDLNDITVGTNDYTGTNGGKYPATTGYDMASGLGTPTAALFQAGQLCGTGPSITSTTTTTFRVGRSRTFTVTTTGSNPIKLLETGALPAGLAFRTMDDGTATISGRPKAGAGGSYPLTLTASNSVGSQRQSFTLVVHQAPAFTSAATTTFPPNETDSFTVTTSGYPAASIRKSGSLPKTLHFETNGNGTATISGRPVAVKVKTYTVRLTATNGVGKAAVQTFTVTVD